MDNPCYITTVISITYPLKDKMQEGYIKTILKGIFTYTIA